MPQRDQLPEHKINDLINSPTVRLVGENIEQGIFPTSEALKMAQDLDLDLVTISERAEPPICRIVDYNKFLFEQKKKQKDLKAKTVKSILKEIRFGPNTDDHDVDFKVKHAITFLEEGSKIKAYVHFKGRTIIHTDRGHKLLDRFLKAIEEHGRPDAPPKMEGKRLIVMINPRVKK
jgi:translation initiation factor IF-3